MINNQFANFSLADLNVVKGDLVVNGNSVLTSVTLPGLLSVGGTLSITANNIIKTIQLAQMSEVGEVKITGTMEK